MQKKSGLKACTLRRKKTNTNFWKFADLGTYHLIDF